MAISKRFIELLEQAKDLHMRKNEAYAGSDAVNAYGVHTGQPNHYSGYIFTDARTVAGNASMPSITGTTEVGHVGNGYAIIKYVE